MSLSAATATSPCGSIHFLKHCQVINPCLTISGEVVSRYGVHCLNSRIWPALTFTEPTALDVAIKCSFLGIRKLTNVSYRLNHCSLDYFGYLSCSRHHGKHYTCTYLTCQLLFTDSWNYFSSLFYLTINLSHIKMPRMAKKNGLLTVAEAAREKGVTRQAIHAAIKAGRLPVVQIGSISLRIEPQALAEFEMNPNKQSSGRRPRTTRPTSGRVQGGLK